MDFWKITKYVLTIVFVGIIIVAVANTPSETATQSNTQLPAATQQPQTKFNF